MSLVSYNSQVITHLIENGGVPPAMVPEIPQASEDLPSEITTSEGSIGNSTDYARADHVHPFAGISASPNPATLASKDIHSFNGNFIGVYTGTSDSSFPSSSVSENDIFLNSSDNTFYIHVLPQEMSYFELRWLPVVKDADDPIWNTYRWRGYYQSYPISGNQNNDVCCDANGYFRVLIGGWDIDMVGDSYKKKANTKGISEEFARADHTHILKINDIVSTEIPSDTTKDALIPSVGAVKNYVTTEFSSSASFDEVQDPLIIAPVNDKNVLSLRISNSMYYPSSSAPIEISDTVIPNNKAIRKLRASGLNFAENSGSINVDNLIVNVSDTKLGDVIKYIKSGNIVIVFGSFMNDSTTITSRYIGDISSSNNPFSDIFPIIIPVYSHNQTVCGVIQIVKSSGTYRASYLGDTIPANIDVQFKPTMYITAPSS
jgi:hypothetical protein